MEGVLERDSGGVGRRRGWPKTTRYNLAEEERMRGGDHIKQRAAAASFFGGERKSKT